MTAWPRWVLSAATVSSTVASVVVKKGMEPPGVEQGVLSRGAVLGGVEVGDAADHQPARDSVDLPLCGERDERHFGNLGAGDPGSGGRVEDRVGVLDGGP